MRGRNRFCPSNPASFIYFPSNALPVRQFRGEYIPYYYLYMKWNQNEMMNYIIYSIKVLVEKFGLLARFGFMHLIATNVSLWIRTVVWESANEWLHYLHHQQLHHGAAGEIAGGAVAQRQYAGRTGAGYMPSADYSYFDDEADFPASNNIDYITGINQRNSIIL